MYSNYKIIFSNKVEINLENFINYMWDNCRYRDSWLYDEDLIVNEFINDIKVFVENLRFTIESKINAWILWQIEASNEIYEETKLVIFLRSYNIVCKCRKWKKEKIISIDDIHIKT